MATLSTVVVDFIANTAKYIQGLKVVENETKKTANNASKNFDGISKSSKNAGNSITSFGRQAAQLRNILVGGAIVSYTKQLIDSASRLQDLSDQLNVSTSTLQRFETIFQKSGNTVEDVSTVFNKLQKSAIEAADGNKSLQDTFVRLGIDVTRFNQLSPEDKVDRFAKALQSIPEPAQRAALAQEILGKSSAKLLNSLQEIGESDGIKKATDGVFVNSQEAIAALDRLGDSATSTFTSITRAAIEAAGKIVLATEELIKLQSKTPGGSTTGAAFMGQGGLGTAGNFAKAIAEAPTGLEKNLLQEARQEQALLRQRAAADRERAAALALQAEAFRKVRDSILAAVDPAAKYASEVDKINEIVAKNKLSEEDRQKLIAGISESYILAVDATKKYAAEIAKINADKGLSDKQKADNIKLLGRAYDEIIDPASKYKTIIEDLNAQVANGIRTDEERRKVIDSLGASFRAVYDPAEKYKKVLEDVNALPRGSNVNILEYIRNTNKEFRNILKPLADFDDKLNEVDAYFKAQQERERQTLQQIYDRYRAEGTLTQQRLDLLNQEGEAMTKRYNEERDYVRRNLIEAKTATLQREAAALANDDALAAEATLREDLLRIRTLERAAQQGESKVTISESLKRQMNLQAEAKYFMEVNKEIMIGFQYMSDFADQFSRAIVEGQNFGDALKNVFKNILRDITALIIRTTILQGIMAAIGFINPVAGAAFGRLTGIVAPAAGPGRAEGGPVMAGQAYRVGEIGPETFVPSTNGMIIPNDFQGAGEQINVIQNISIQTGVAQTVRAEMFGLLPRFKQEAMAGVLDAKQRGGSYAKGLAPA